MIKKWSTTTYRERIVRVLERDQILGRILALSATELNWKTRVLPRWASKLALFISYPANRNGTLTFVSLQPIAQLQLYRIYNLVSCP